MSLAEKLFECFKEKDTFTLQDGEKISTNNKNNTDN